MRFTTILVLLAMLSSWAFAGPKEFRELLFTDPDTCHGLLKRDSIIGELHLTQKQRDRIEDVWEDRFELRKEMVMNGEEDSLRLRGTEEERTKVNTKMLELLTDAQRLRLRELLVQQAGYQGAACSDMAKLLGVTEEQAKKISEIDARGTKEAREALGVGIRTGQDESAMRAAYRKVRAKTAADIGIVLTEEQRKKLDDMKGKPFAFPENEW